MELQRLGASRVTAVNASATVSRDKVRFPLAAPLSK
jgi:hypothetical protein